MRQNMFLIYFYLYYISFFKINWPLYGDIRLIMNNISYFYWRFPLKKIRLRLSLRGIFPSVAFVLALTGGEAWGRDVTDMVGRHITLPDRIERVYASSPPANLLVAAVAPESLIGLALKVRDEDKRFLPPVLVSLPFIGASGGNQINLETLVALKPQVVIAWAQEGNDLSKVTEPFDRLGLPVLFLTLDRLADYPQRLTQKGLSDFSHL